ncbi:MAG: FAD-dependent oxidoreductase [Dehalococcoidales bacterium]|nr:FAD-dependent oxidoreductase [Dehalococcoidales bacterium]
MKKTERIKYLIIGNSAGGIGAAEAIREVDKNGTIIIVSDEPYPAYSRPLISDYLSGKRSIEKMNYRPFDFYEKNSISTILGEKVNRVDFKNNTVTFSNGHILTWEKLLIATGGTPIVPPMDGKEARGVFTFTTLGDARAIDEYLNQKTGANAVVIGGGLIGVSVTESLLKRGVKVSIIEMKDRVLNIILDEITSAMEDKAIRASGAEIITGHTVTKINSNSRGEVESVTLDDGKTIPCSIVIISIGIRPRLELVQNSEIKINRGIVVNMHMETSIPNVYACGDAAEAYDFIYRENRLTPIWPNAYLGGRIAGLNMSGKTAEYPGGTALNAIKYFGVYIVSAGMAASPDSTYEEVVANGESSYKKLILKEGFITGMVFSGDVDRAGIIYNLMKDRLYVNSFKNDLVTENFGLLSLPEKIWRNRLATSPLESDSSKSSVSPC